MRDNKDLVQQKQTISGKTYLSKVSITPNIYYSYAVGAISNHYDIQSIMTHETDHALGIAHCHEAGETHGTDDHKNAVYQYVPNNTTDARTLKSYDTASKRNLYWNAH